MRTSRSLRDDICLPVNDKMTGLTATGGNSEKLNLCRPYQTEVKLIRCKHVILEKCVGTTCYNFYNGHERPYRVIVLNR